MSAGKHVAREDFHMAQNQAAGGSENNAIGVSGTPTSPRKRGRPAGSGGR